MRGVNKLVLNADEMCQALQIYLRNIMTKELVRVTSVRLVTHTTEEDEFEVTFEDSSGAPASPEALEDGAPKARA
jgi:hypothetical protein